ncbi:MAG: arylsulfatase [Acidobacterium ailaaui]|nr:arylsulfatase [Pseudacidobacterium ailaaui]
MKHFNLILFTAFFILFSAAGSAQSQRKLSQHPNIIYILADDLGYGDIGAYGQKKIETPNIDALAKAGMIFTQYYAAPVCAPSRYCLMTGQNTGHAFIRGNDEWEERGDVWSFKAMEANPALEGQLPIPDSTLTIAKILKKAGYTTAIVGKWGLGGPFTTGIPNNQGFDYFFGFLCQRQDHNYYPGHLWENTLRVPLNNKATNPNIKFPKNLDPLDPKNYAVYAQNDYAPDFLIKAALKFIRENKDHPFFLYYASPLPHASLQAPQKWVDYYLKKFGTNEKPFLGGDGYLPVRYPHATRAAMVSLLDHHVGEIVKELKELGIYKNTIIIFTGDNGTTYEGGTDGPFFDSGGPLKSAYGWGKGFLYEGGIREPFVISWPDRIKPGTKSDLITACWDFVPTICQLIGVKPPSGIQGISFLPTLLGHPKEQKRHPYLYWEFPGYGGQQAVRLDNWKGIIMDMQKGNTKMQLFNLDNDIQEEHDVAAQHPDVVKQIQAIMKQEHTFPQVKSFRMKVLDGE